MHKYVRKPVLDVSGRFLLLETKVNLLFVAVHEECNPGEISAIGGWG